MSTIVFGAGMFAKKALVSCAGLAISNDQEKYPKSSRSKSFTRLGNGQKRLTE